MQRFVLTWVCLFSMLALNRVNHFVQKHRGLYNCNSCMNRNTLFSEMTIHFANTALQIRRGIKIIYINENINNKLIHKCVSKIHLVSHLTYSIIVIIVTLEDNDIYYEAVLVYSKHGYGKSINWNGNTLIMISWAMTIFMFILHCQYLYEFVSKINDI